MRPILILSWLTAAAYAGCVAVSSDRILAGELRSAVPLFEQLDPGTVVGFAPIPGTQRWLSVRELGLFFRRQGFDLPKIAPGSGICVERAVRPLSRQEVTAALAQGLEMPDATLEVLEFNSQALPPGRLDFPRSGLNRPPLDSPDLPALWRGRLVYDGRRSMAVWAKVRITVERPAFVALESIPAGAVIEAGQVKEIRQRQFPSTIAAPLRRDQIVGKAARRAIAQSQPFLLSTLEEPKDISRGDKVRVTVIEGLATLTMDAIAGSSGSKGDSILLHNPATGKNFRGVVEDKGKVVMRSSPGA